MNFEHSWKSLNKKLRSIEQLQGGLSAALIALEMQQRECGFIKDDLHEIRRMVFRHPERNVTLRAQVNPKRSRRHSGSGLLNNKNLGQYKNSGCFLCRENIKWQQEQRQMGFEIMASSAKYVALMNPFPLLPNHVVVASRNHMSQDLKLLSNQKLGRKLHDVVLDLCQLAQRLPNHIGFYNGVGAGASIPEHFHFQFFQREPSMPVFPIEERDFTVVKNDGEPSSILGYPINVFRWHGDLEKVVNDACKWIPFLISQSRLNIKNLTANFIATTCNSENHITLYFAPRSKKKKYWNGNKGIVGGLEILGELVMASKEECALIEDGNVDYFFIERALSAVSIPLEI